MRDYEIMVVLQPGLDDEGVAAAVKGVTDAVEADAGIVHFTGQLADRKGNVAAIRDSWKTRRLAYAIEHHQEAYYAVIRFSVKPSALDEIERILNLDDDVLRHLVTRHEAGFAESPAADDSTAEASPS
jgi:small subunit ribosomal protein S6